MKTFQKIALVSAIAAAPFAAQAELTPMNDSLMSDTTGQAGVTIEITIAGSGISIGSVEYVDEGSVTLENITVKNVTNLTQTIDVDTDGNLLMGMTGANGIQIGLGGDGDTIVGEFSGVKLTNAAGDIEAELINNLDITLNVGDSVTEIMNLGGAAGSNTLEAAAIADGFGANAFEGSVAIRSKSSVQITDMNVGMFGYTRDQAEAQTAVTADQDAIASGSAINIGGIQFYQLAADGVTKGAASIDQVIWAKGGSVADGAGLYVQIGEIAGTLEIGSIAFGTSPSIGTVKVSDINLAGLTQRIYGH